MPLTPEANLSRSECSYQCLGLLDLLNQFFGLDIVHSMNSSDTVTKAQTQSGSALLFQHLKSLDYHVPNG